MLYHTSLYAQCKTTLLSHLTCRVGQLTASLHRFTRGANYTPLTSRNMEYAVALLTRKATPVKNNPALASRISGTRCITVRAVTRCSSLCTTKLSGGNSSRRRVAARVARVAVAAVGWWEVTCGEVYKSMGRSLSPKLQMCARMATRSRLECNPNTTEWQLQNATPRPILREFQLVEARQRTVSLLAMHATLHAYQNRPCKPRQRKATKGKTR
jgi:hypothetical protein